MDLSRLLNDFMYRQRRAEVYHGAVVPTLCQETLGGVGGEPGLAVGGLVQLLDELKLVGHLAVVVQRQALRVVLHVLHVLEVELAGHTGRTMNCSERMVGASYICT